MNDLDCDLLDRQDELWIAAEREFLAGNFDSSLFLFKRLHSEGCFSAALEIGNIYELGGNGVNQSDSLASKWYKKAVAESDDPKAHLAIGRMLIRTAKSDIDYEKALEHFKKIKNEEIGALYGLGLLYDRGLGVSEDKEKACQYYLEASKLGHVAASVSLHRINLRRQTIRGILPWIKSLKEAFLIALRDPTDKRLGVR